MKGSIEHETRGVAIHLPTLLELFALNGSAPTSILLSKRCYSTAAWIVDYHDMYTPSDLGVSKATIW
jgi:hypothetical protein